MRKGLDSISDKYFEFSLKTTPLLRSMRTSLCARVFKLNSKYLSEGLYILIILFLFVLSGCSSLLSPVPSNFTSTYVVNTLPCMIPQSSHTRGTLLVALPDTVSIFNTDQIAYARHPLEIAYFSKNGWAAPPAQMLQPLLLETLYKTHHFHAVIPRSVAGNFKLLLNTEILDWKHVFYTCPSHFQVRLRAQLINAHSSHIIAEREFFVSVPAKENTPFAVAVAANQAVSELLEQVALFCVR